MNIFQKKFWSSLDYWLIAALLILSLFGVVCIGSATRINQGADPTIFRNQILFLLSGLVLLFFFAGLNLDSLARYSMCRLERICASTSARPLVLRIALNAPPAPMISKMFAIEPNRVRYESASSPCPYAGEFPAGNRRQTQR